jgi:hypothetical protein
MRAAVLCQLMPGHAKCLWAAAAVRGCELHALRSRKARPGSANAPAAEETTPGTCQLLLLSQRLPQQATLGRVLWLHCAASGHPGGTSDGEGSVPVDWGSSGLRLTH